MKSKRTTKKLTKKEREAALRKRHIQTALFWVVPILLSFVFVSLPILGKWYYLNSGQYDAGNLVSNIVNHHTSVLDAISGVPLVYVIFCFKYTILLLLCRKFIHMIKNKNKKAFIIVWLTVIACMLVSLWYEAMVIFVSGYPLVDQDFVVIAALKCTVVPSIILIVFLSIIAVALSVRKGHICKENSRG